MSINLDKSVKKMDKLCLLKLLKKWNQSPILNIFLEPSTASLLSLKIKLLLGGDKINMGKSLPQETSHSSHFLNQLKYQST
jgi:hypothetical protein